MGYTNNTAKYEPQGEVYVHSTTEEDEFELETTTISMNPALYSFVLLRQNPIASCHIHGLQRHDTATPSRHRYMLCRNTWTFRAKQNDCSKSNTLMNLERIVIMIMIITPVAAIAVIVTPIVLIIVVSIIV